MINLSLIRVLKVFLVVILSAIYILNIWIYSLDYKGKDLAWALRHVVLVAGFVPWCFWVYALLIGNGAKFILCSIIVTVFHVFVFSVSAHYDGLVYWIFQAIELAFLAVLVKHFRKKSTRNSDEKTNVTRNSD